jgi:predicted nucleic acid-binding Zn ribbon protein
VRLERGDVAAVMPRLAADREVSPETAVALLARSCPACGAALSGRKKACGGRCRGLLTNRRQAEARAAWLLAWAVRAYTALGVV